MILVAIIRCTQRRQPAYNRSARLNGCRNDPALWDTEKLRWDHNFTSHGLSRAINEGYLSAADGKPLAILKRKDPKEMPASITLTSVFFFLCLSSMRAGNANSMELIIRDKLIFFFYSTLQYLVYLRSRSSRAIISALTAHHSAISLRIQFVIHFITHPSDIYLTPVFISTLLQHPRIMLLGSTRALSIGGLGIRSKRRRLQSF